MEVRKTIDILKGMKLTNASFLTCISNFNLLIEALEELDSMVEMDKVKETVVAQIKFLLINQDFDGHMLHTVIYGPPGCGKTDLGKILAKLWMAIRSFKTNNKSNNKSNNIQSNIQNNITSSQKETNLEKQIINLNVTSKMKNAVIKRLQSHVLNIKTIIKSDAKLTNEIIYKLKTLKREIDKFELTLTSRSCNLLIDECVNKTKQLKDRLENNSTNTISDENVHFTLTIPVPPNNTNNLNTTSNLSNLNNDSDEESSENVDEIRDEITNVDEITNEINDEITNEINNEITNENKITINLPNTNLNEQDLLKPKKFDLIRIVSREDFIASYLGQTAVKTEALLKDSIGKVLFIDEAYSLIHDDRDSYGMEALTCLNRFMSEHADEIIIIFAGYKDLLENTIFKFQPGLRRRTNWAFQIDGYSANGLAKIFETQLVRDDWILTPEINIVKFFQENMNDFPNFGGDTQRLVFYCKLNHACQLFEDPVNSSINKIITRKMLNDALDMLRNHRIEDNGLNNFDNVSHMYV